MTESVVLAAPILIPPTHLSFQVAMEVAKTYADGGLQLKFLGGPLAQRPTFIIALDDVETSLAVYMGHGTPFELLMDNLVSGLGFGVSDTPWLRDKILIALPCCEAGEILAPRAIDNGCKAVIASIDPYFAAFVEDSHDFMADWIDYILVLYRTLMKETIGDSYYAYQEKCTECIELYESKLDVWPEADWYVNSTLRNRDDTMLFGDPQAKIDYVPSKRERNIIEEVIAMILGK